MKTTKIMYNFLWKNLLITKPYKTIIQDISGIILFKNYLKQFSFNTPFLFWLVCLFFAWGLWNWNARLCTGYVTIHSYVSKSIASCWCWAVHRSI